MPTNAQRYGTRNLTANLPEDYIGELGKKAFVQFKGCRTKLVISALEFWAAAHDPALAARLKEIRRRFYGTMLLLIFCATLFSHDVLRRPARRGRETELVSATEPMIGDMPR
jgi:hypothetical protein